MSEIHPVCDVLDRVEAVLDAAVAAAGEWPAAVGMSGLSDVDLQDIARRVWRLVQRLQGGVLVPTIAEADQRRLHKTTRYASAGSMWDLVSGWLRCDPVVAGRLLRVGKQCVNGSFTATGTALASGEIEVDHATTVVGAVRKLPPFIDRGQRVEGACQVFCGSLGSFVLFVVFVRVRSLVTGCDSR